MATVAPPAGPRTTTSPADYKRMQKEYYSSGQFTPEHIVGNYDWHEQFPYETQLLFKNGDLRTPLLHDYSTRTALDFACGPGRMVKRLAPFFQRVDGVDISPVLLAAARRDCPGSTFYESDGDNLGACPRGHYDFIYSTIAMQHICVRSTRLKILSQIRESLKVGGAICVQMAFHAEFPHIHKTHEWRLFGKRLIWLRPDLTHREWDDENTGAQTTNGYCDTTISRRTLPLALADFSTYFDDVTYWFYDVSLIYANLNGTRHDLTYWPTHWIFIGGTKRSDETRRVDPAPVAPLTLHVREPYFQRTAKKYVRSVKKRFNRYVLGKK